MAIATTAWTREDTAGNAGQLAFISQALNEIALALDEIVSTSTAWTQEAP